MNYKVYEANLAGLIARLTTLNKRGARLGAAPITWTVTSHEDVAVEGQPGMFERIVNIEVNGETPKFNGWSFVGTLNHTVEGNVIRAVPGLEVPVQFRNRQPVCDHCQTSRNRRDTYIVRHDDGSVKQVGSNCLKDFLGHTDPAKLAAAAELLLGVFDVCEAHTGRGGNAMNIFRIDLPEYLNAVATVVLRDGKFVTRKQSREQEGLVPTSELAMNLFNSHRFQQGHWTDAAKKLATDAREWVIKKYAPHLLDDGSDADLKASMLNYLTNRNDSLSDFEHNLLVVANCEAIEPKMAGVAAYIIEAFRRAQPKAQATQLNVAGLAVILGMFGKAKENLKFPAIRLMDEQRHEYQLSLAGAASKNAGCIYVKGAKVGSYNTEEGATRPYLGKITPQGRFFPVRECPANVETELLKFAADPEAIATRYGRMTGCCCFCGRKLTDARSTEVGYGPICADKFGLDWGKKAEVAPVAPAPVAEP